MSHAHKRPGSTRLAAALLIVPLLAGGCTGTKTRRLARFDTGGNAPVLRPAPESGVYKVKYAGRSRHDLHAVGGTGRIVGEGETIGFAAGPDGAVVAVAGDEQIPLDHLPPAARYCVWSFKEKKPTQFTKEVGKATETAGQAAAVAGAVALVGGLVVADLYLDSMLDKSKRERDGKDDDCRRKKRRGYRWVGAQRQPQQAAPTIPVPPTKKQKKQ